LTETVAAFAQPPFPFVPGYMGLFIGTEESLRRVPLVISNGCVREENLFFETNSGGLQDAASSVGDDSDDGGTEPYGAIREQRPAYNSSSADCNG
jgi:hypothetical protein